MTDCGSTFSSRDLGQFEEELKILSNEDLPSFPFVLALEETG